MRNFKAGKASIPAFLDDYALVADAFVALYQVCFDPQWLRLSEGLLDHVKAHFYNPATQFFYFTSDQDAALIARKTEVMDNVIPASNSVLANAFFDLGHLLGRADYLEAAERMLQNIQQDMPRYGSGYSNWAILMQKFLQPFCEVVVTGPEAIAFAQALDRIYNPNKILVAAVSEQGQQLELLAGRFVENETYIYVCQGNACQLPVKDVAAAVALMEKLTKSE